MPRFCFVLLFIVALAFHVNAASPHAASPPADQIFPDSTKGFLSIRNLDEFGEKWGKTQMGQLWNDPLMANFQQEIQRQLTENIEQTFGLTLEGITSLPTGELAFGMIAVPSQIPGYVLTMDVAGQRAEANEYLANLTQRLITAGVRRTTETYRGQQISVLTFPAPQTPTTIRGARGEIVIAPIERQAFYMFWQDVLIASDRLHLLHLIADRLAGQSTTGQGTTGQGTAGQAPARALAEVEAYQVIMNRCLRDTPEGVQPIIRWYIEPLDYGESVRIAVQNRNPAAQARRERPSIFSVLRQQGFDAILGIGGTVSVKVEEQETVYRTFIHTQKPYRLAMQMFDFPNSTNFTSPTWMPADLARRTIFHVNPLAIFDNFGVLFDAIIMPGEEGVWRDILDGLENDPHGPQINIRDELIAHLGNRILGMSRYEQPITIRSESIVIAIELKPGHEPAMSAGIEKLFGTDPEMMSTIHREYTIWHRRPAMDIIAPDIFQIEGIPCIFGSDSSDSRNTAPMGTTPMGIVRGQQPMDEDRPPMFPEGGIVVARGCLFVSTNIEYLKIILDRLDTTITSSIQDATEYQHVQQIFAGMGLTDTPHFFQFFARTHETLRPTYEMIRMDRMAQSQALLAQLLNEFLAPEEETGIRRQIIDGSTLPPFDAVEHYFGTVGIFGVSEEDGYFIKGFTLERE